MSARDLYQEIILEHARQPQNFGPLPTATAHAQGENLSCGDSIALHLQIENGQLVAVRFEGEGCALSMASASMMTGVIEGKTVGDAAHLAERMRAYISGQAELDPALEDFEVFEGVRKFPARVKCVVLPWVALAEALEA